MTERREPEDMGEHEVEIETMWPGFCRASCSCGFLGPTRASRRSARLDRDAHMDRRAEGQA